MAIKEQKQVATKRKVFFINPLVVKIKLKAALRKHLQLQLKLVTDHKQHQVTLALGKCSVHEAITSWPKHTYFQKALSISETIGNPQIECHCCCSLSLTKLSRNNFQEAFSFLFRSIENSEKIRGFLQDSDQFKISFEDAYAFPYQQLSELFCFVGNPKDALYLAELGCQDSFKMAASEVDLSRRIGRSEFQEGTGASFKF